MISLHFESAIMEQRRQNSVGRKSLIVFMDDVLLRHTLQRSLLQIAYVKLYVV